MSFYRFTIDMTVYGHWESNGALFESKLVQNNLVIDNINKLVKGLSRLVVQFKIRIF